MGKTPEKREDRKRAEGESAAAHPHALHAASGRLLWPFIAFLLLSMWAHAGFRHLPPIPPEWKSLLGAPPPPSLINVLFVVYLLSALMLNLMRMANDAPPDPGYRPVAFLAGFYAFHHLSGSLRDNFLVVLVGGVVLLTLECLRNFQYYRQKLRDL